MQNQKKIITEIKQNVNNYADNYFAMIGHAQYAHQKKKRRFMRVKPCEFYMEIIIIEI